MHEAFFFLVNASLTGILVFFHHCKILKLPAHKSKISAIRELPGGGGGGGSGSQRQRALSTLKVSHQDCVSPVFESAFHSGHFYRAIQPQDVREMTGGVEGL